jgi:hypothetical protein
MLRLHIRREGRKGAGRRQQSDYRWRFSDTDRRRLPPHVECRLDELAVQRVGVRKKPFAQRRFVSCQLGFERSCEHFCSFPVPARRKPRWSPRSRRLRAHYVRSRCPYRSAYRSRIAAMPREVDAANHAAQTLGRIMLTGTYRETTTAEQQTPQSRHVEPRFVTPAAMLVVRMHSVQGTYTGALSTAIVSVETQRNSGYCQAIWTTVSFVRPSLTNSAAVAGLLSVTELVSVLGGQPL